MNEISETREIPQINQINQINQTNELSELNDGALRPNLGPPPPRPDWRRGRQS
jgi:hypothetical protein